MGDINRTVRMPNSMGRGYLHPVDGRKLIGVSTVKEWAIAKPYLRSWGEGLVADRAVDFRNDPDLAIPFDDARLKEWLLAAPRDATRGASNDGDMVHEWSTLYHQDPDCDLPREVDPAYPLANLERVRSMCAVYRQLCQQWRLTVLFNEQTVCNSVLGIAGTFDFIGSSPFIDDGEPFVGDRKTTNGVKPRSDVTFQLPMYAGADEIWDPLSDEEKAPLLAEEWIPHPEVVHPMPTVNQHRGYVIKVKAIGGGIHRVEYRNEKYRIDMFAEIEAAVNHYRWAEHADKMVSLALPHPETPTEADTDARIAAARSRPELEAVYRWAVSEGVWVSDRHLELSQTKISEIE